MRTTNLILIVTLILTLQKKVFAAKQVLRDEILKRKLQNDEFCDDNSRGEYIKEVDALFCCKDQNICEQEREWFIEDTKTANFTNKEKENASEL